MAQQIEMPELATVEPKRPSRWGNIPPTAAATYSFPMVMYLLYLAMEYMRPANPLGIPLVLSVILFMSWLINSKKRWVPQFWCFIGLLGVIGVMVPFAANNFAAFMELRQMGIQFVCISIPLVHIVSNIKRFAVSVNGLIAVMVYVAIYAIVSGGRGPGGHVGDENDTALALNSVVALAFLSMFTAKTMLQRVWFGFACGTMVLGVIVSMSRGGFLGLIAVLGYVLMLTPNKGRTLAIGLVMLLVVLPLAPEKYWDEMASIGTEAANDDPNKGTGALRREYWLVAREMFLANPVFGVGGGNFRWNVGTYQTKEQYDRLGRSLDGQECHSVYFSTLAELGGAGFGLFLLILWYNFKDLEALLHGRNRVIDRQARRSELAGTSLEVCNHRKPRGEGKRKDHRRNFEVSWDMASVAKDEQLSRIRMYAHGLRGGFLGFLVTGVFLSAFTYPPFWLLTSYLVALKYIELNAPLDSSSEA